MSMNVPPQRRGTVRIGLIGAGEVVRTIHLPVLQQVRAARVEWVVDKDGSRAELIAAQSGTAIARTTLDSCPKVDAVLIAIPVGVRHEAWKHAFERGWHVLCEKPVAASTADFDVIVSKMSASGRAMRPGLMRRFYANTLLARRLVHSGIFGELREAWAGEGGRANRTGRGGEWYQLDRALAGGGILIETGSHLIDQVMFIAGATHASVDAYEQEPPGRTMEFKTAVKGSLWSGSRERIPFTCSLSRVDDVRNGIFLRFDKLVLRVDPGAEGTVHICDMDSEPVAPLAVAGMGATNSAQAFHLQWLSFLNSCTGAAGADADGDYRLTRLAVQIIDECYARAAARLPCATVV